MNNSPALNLINDHFQKEEFSFTFEVGQETKQKISISFMEENILKFSSLNSSKKSKFELNHVVPLELKQNNSPNFEYEEKADFMEIFPKTKEVDFKVRVNKKPFFIDIVKVDNNEKVMC